MNQATLARTREEEDLLADWRGERVAMGREAAGQKEEKSPSPDSVMSSLPAAISMLLPSLGRS